MYDTIIIGAGPAGMTAGIYAVRREMKTLIIGKELGGQVLLASEIENYPGFKKISNFELISKIKEHVTSLGVKIKEAEIQKIEKQKDGSFILHTKKEKFKSKTIIVAIGLTPRRLNIEGEYKFLGKGVTYCVNCDGPFYKDKIVAVVGGGNSALDAAEVLSKIAKKVYLIHRGEKFSGFEILVNKIKIKNNIEVLMNNEVKDIIGKNKVETIVIFDNKNNKLRKIKLNGVFVEIGRRAKTGVVANLVKRDKHNQILIDEKGKTSMEGVFAAGDVTQVEFKQITIAMGQATIATLSAYKYLQLSIK